MYQPIVTPRTPIPPEVRFRHLDILWVDNQDALGWIKEEAPQSSSHHNVPHVLLEIL